MLGLILLDGEGMVFGVVVDTGIEGKSDVERDGGV